jgi:hypothetical protein
LRLRHVDELVESNENALRDAGIKKSDEERAASTWRLSLPFTNPELKRRDSYLVPQLLAINIRPVLEGSVHRLPRTVIVASTEPALRAILTKVTGVMRTLGRDPQYGNIAVPTYLATAYHPSSDEYISERIEEFVDGTAPIIICSPDYAKTVLRYDVEQVWWLNVKAQVPEHRLAVEGLLQGLADCRGKLMTPMTVTICLGEDDTIEAAMIKRWLQEHLRASYPNIIGVHKFEEILG